MTVLVLTRASDAVADLVIGELNDRAVPLVRLDPGDFPEHLTIRARTGPGTATWHGALRGQYRDLDLGDVHAVYYRRPSAHRLAAALSADDAAWAHSEARAGLGGLLAALDCTWVNHPHRNAYAALAPVALATAARCGLTVPRTLITNDPDEARAFVGDLPGKMAAYKSLGPGGPTAYAGSPYALWTTQVRVDDIDDSVRLTAHQFQQWIPKAYEVRLTAVDDRMFAAEIHAGTDAAAVDFRTDYDSLTYRLRTVPEHIADGMYRLLGELGLRYAASDFLVSQDDGGWYLVDVNPNGQFGFIPELRTPIARALADLLEGTAHDHHRIGRAATPPHGRSARRRGNPALD
ncbi:ATP-grasp ribosomal peptide maturase [Streptomyces sp. LX-29]|uniref:ATP-grasp ribosomal peptide maturase n=1 Tax=Streptomyces sp. LX-29 TaxID=2900152 RepID=UPI00240DBCA1|nr:ATP-grasp ribosomal peptide maturase [Streptomyces sp. LX-29]WFB06423.1 ATP-grasp ribosomal peptide maturase [Streptomyces sp. LX-29]